MKKKWLMPFACVAAAALVLPLSAGVVKKTRSEIEFRGFGRFVTVQTELLTPTHRRADMSNEFKGKGLLGGLAGRALLRPGEVSEIVDLPALSMISIDHKRKEYTQTAIGRWTEMGEDVEFDLDREEAVERPEPEESDIVVTRNEFTVEDTGQTSVIAGFEARKYVIRWILEWENVKTGETGDSRLETLSWNTPVAGDLAGALAVESAFSREYAKALGLDDLKIERDLLGTAWLDILDAMSEGPREGAPARDVSRFSAEMAKIEGYPVLIDGKYFVSRPEAEVREVEQEERGVAGRLGGLAKRAIKKKAPVKTEEEPALSYRIELIEVKPADPGEADFAIPAGYKKKG